MLVRIALLFTVLSSTSLAVDERRLFGAWPSTLARPTGAFPGWWRPFGDQYRRRTTTTTRAPWRPFDTFHNIIYARHTTTAPTTTTRRRMVTTTRAPIYKTTAASTWKYTQPQSTTAAPEYNTRPIAETHIIHQTTTTAHTAPENTLPASTTTAAPKHTTPTTTPHPVTRPFRSGIDAGHAKRCFRGSGFYVEPADCTKYYRCHQWPNRRFTVWRFDCAPGTVFSERRSTCVFPSQPDCRRRREPICRRVGFFANATDCSAFIACAGDNGGEIVDAPYRCPAGTFFDESAPACVGRRHFDAANCRMPKEGRSLLPLLRSAFSKSTRCTKSGFSVSDHSCAGFLACISGVGGNMMEVEFTCPESTRFSDHHAGCVRSGSDDSCHQ